MKEWIFRSFKMKKVIFIYVLNDKRNKKNKLMYRGIING